MRSIFCCILGLSSLPLLAQQKGPVQGATKAAARELTPEGYRDLIVNTADALKDFGAYGEITRGTGVEYIPGGGQRHCIMTFTFKESAAQDAAKRRKVWASARPPKPLGASHADILKWMDSALPMARRLPACFEPLLQASAEQYGFLRFMGQYDDLRKEAAAALAGLGVTLPPLEKEAPEKK